jgi:hypothetical protein
MAQPFGRNKVPFVVPVPPQPTQCAKGTPCVPDDKIKESTFLLIRACSENISDQ